MDQDLKQYLGERFDAIMDAQQRMASEVRDIRTAQTQLGEAQQKMRLDQEKMEREMKRLRETVGVSIPPEGGDGPSPPPVPIIKRVTESNLDVESLRGTVIAVDAKVGELAEVVNTIKDQNSRQLQALGTEEKGIAALVSWMFKEKDGQKFFFSAFAAITGLVTAIGTTYALLTGRLPMPNSPPPASIIAPQENHQ